MKTKPITKGKEKPKNERKQTKDNNEFEQKDKKRLNKKERIEQQRKHRVDILREKKTEIKNQLGVAQHSTKSMGKFDKKAYQTERDIRVKRRKVHATFHNIDEQLERNK